MPDEGEDLPLEEEPLEEEPEPEPYLIVDDVTYRCGGTDVANKLKLQTWDGVYVCLVFDDVKGLGMKKVMFMPRMDFFEVMEIQGLYDIFKEESDVTVRALSNAKISRPTNFKFERGSAETLNLVIEVKDGSIESL